MNIKQAIKKFMKLNNILIQRPNKYTHYLCGSGCVVLKIASITYEGLQKIVELPDVGIGETRTIDGGLSQFDLEGAMDKNLEKMNLVDAKDTHFIRECDGKREYRIFASESEFIYVNEDYLKMVEPFLWVDGWLVASESASTHPVVSKDFVDGVGAVVFPCRVIEDEYIITKR